MPPGAVGASADAAPASSVTSEIFQDLINEVTNNDREWKEFWDAERPEELPLPGRLGRNPYVTLLQRLCVLRCLRPDRVYVALAAFVSRVLGERFITPPVLDFDVLYA